MNNIILNFTRILMVAVMLAGGGIGNIYANASGKTQGERILQDGMNSLDKNRTKQALQYYNRLGAYPVEQNVMAWAIAVYGKGVNYNSLKVLSAHFDNWPKKKQIERNIERAAVKSDDDKLIHSLYAENGPNDFQAAFELARKYYNNNNKKLAYKIIIPFWRDKKLDKFQERDMKNTFRSLLKKDDYQARVELLLGEQLLNRAKGLAQLADMVKLVDARIAVERNYKNAGALLKPLYKSHGTDPNFLLSLARYFRRGEEIIKAGETLISATNPHKNSGEPVLARTTDYRSELMEKKKYKIAYQLVAKNVAQSATKKIDCEFYAGWIALRFLKNAKLAEQHFQQINQLATKPLSLSRGHYWLARAYQKQKLREKAKEEYLKAAQYDASYYGQLALIALGKRKVKVNEPTISQRQKDKFENIMMVKAIGKLEKIGQKSKAKLFYQHLARTLTDVVDLTLLAEKMKKRGNYQMALNIGKIAHRSGKNVKNLAWPVGVIPLSNDARATSLAYAISRQESTFQINARSSANALGLMQLLPSTAKVSAKKAGVQYSSSRLVRDAAYNARLGTTYLDSQIKQFDGSYILAFAAYNAGPTTVRKWMKRFGNPRGASMYEAIDWVERIPYAETRNYVQRVMENYQIYKARLAQKPIAIDTDLTKG